jgi:hypothetical protein
MNSVPGINIIVDNNSYDSIYNIICYIPYIIGLFFFLIICYVIEVMINILK